MQKPTVQVDNLGKSYWLYPSNFRRVMGNFVDPKRTGATPLKVLSGLTFDLYPGEAIALIGKNGAGKSTALQILASIIPPSEGSYTVQGRVSALLELGSGFNPEFTGRENIAIAGALAGMTKDDVMAAEPEIIDFADVGDFIDQPVKFYSSGMFLRLAFAVAISGKPDLLIVDEALAVGDVFFRQKCYNRLKQMRANGMAVILVTHSSGDAQEFCDKAVLLERGKQVYAGSPKEAMLRYYFSEQGVTCDALKRSNPPWGEDLPPVSNSSNSGTEFPWAELEKNFISVPKEELTGIFGFSIESFCLTDISDTPCVTFIQGDSLRLYVKYLLKNSVGLPCPSVTIWSSSGIPIHSTNIFLHDVEAVPVPDCPFYVYSMFEIKLDVSCGEYTLGCGLSSIDTSLYASREHSSHEEWVALSKRLTNVNNMASFSVILPMTRTPSRMAGFGLVTLPTQCNYVVR